MAIDMTVLRVFTDRDGNFGNPLGVVDASQAEPGPAGQVKVAREFRNSFPDIHYTFDLLVAENDLVVVRWTSSATMTGKWGNVEPTGRKVTYSGVNIFRLKDGKVVEIWNHRDDLGAQQQLNAPVYAGAAAR